MVGKFFASLLVLLFASPTFSQTRSLDPNTLGYVESACFFDNNNNGIRGEAGECNYCNGTETDPDQDGNDETIIYVDCGSGIDSPACGSTGTPCDTILYGANTRGPAQRISAGTDEIITCFRGTNCNAPNIVLKDGDAGRTVAGPFGFEDFAWSYSDNPAMIIGWDDDADGCYWPADDGTSPPAGCGTAQSEARIGTTGGSYAFQVEGDGTQNYVLAHFSITGLLNAATHDADGANNAGFVSMNDGVEGIYAHNIDMDGFLQNQPKCSGLIGFKLFTAIDEPVHDIRIENITALGVGGYFLRGGVNSPVVDQGPIVIIGLTHTCHPCDNNESACAGCTNSLTSRNSCDILKPWGNVSKVRLLDFKSESDIGITWTGSDKSALSAVVFNDNVQDFAVKQGYIKNFRRCLLSQPDNDSTDPAFILRRQDDIVIDSVWCDYDTGIFHNSSGEAVNRGLSIERGESGENESFMEDLTVTNFVVTATAPAHLEAAILDFSSSPNAGDAGGLPGTHTFQYITINGDQHREQNGDSRAQIQLGDTSSSALADQMARYVLENIIIAGETNASNHNTCVRVEQDVLDHTESITFRNITADPNCDFVYGGSTDTNVDDFAARTQLTDVTTTYDCEPLFDVIDDHTLDVGDSCAKVRGRDIPGITLDAGGDTRTIPTDIGADEVSTVVGPEVCGNFIVETGEDCDDGGTANGDCCDSVCQFESGGGSCGSGASTDCTAPDTCDGAGVCQDNDVTVGMGCDDILFCTLTDTCDGLGSCGGTGDTCPGQVCNETLNQCESSVCGNSILEPGEDCDDGGTANGDCCDSSCNFEVVTSPCDDGLFCTVTDTCDGSGLCGGTGDPCTLPEVCDELVGACVAAPAITTVCDFTPLGTGPTSGVGYEYRNVCRANAAGIGANEIRFTIESTPNSNGCEINAMTFQTANCPDDPDCGVFSGTPFTVTFNTGSTTGTAASGTQLVSDWIPFTYVEEDIWIHVVLGKRGCYEADDNLPRWWANNSGSAPGSSMELSPVQLNTTSDSITIRKVEVRGSAPPAPVCGNSIVEAPEACDDGNTDTGDCCSPTCQFDPGATACGDPTNTTCNPADICGPSGTAPAGVCIDAPRPSGFSCDDTLFCTGVDVCDGEENCVSAGDPCSGTTICNETNDTCDLPPETCGNSILEGSEECDDGNTDNGDCCDSSCDFEIATSPCDDSLFCTLTDTCNGSGTCVGAAAACPVGQSCAESLGICIAAFNSNGTM